MHCFWCAGKLFLPGKTHEERNQHYRRRNYKMKLNQWTLGLAAAGVISLASVAGAEEATSQVLTALSSTTLSGYVDTSIIYRPGTGNGVGAGAFTGGNKQDGFNLNVVKLTLEKPLDEGQWSAGYKVDLLFGPDANIFGTTSTGATTQDFAIKQAYVALRAPVGNGLDFKFGVFDTIIGYEVFESPNNPNYSRSYGWGLEPTTHTGVLASYRVADWMSVAAGVADTRGPTINGRSSYLDSGINAESRKTYMGSITLTAPESFGSMKGAALYAGVIDGTGSSRTGTRNSGGIASDQLNLYAGVTVPLPITGLSVGAAYDYLGNSAQEADGFQIAPSSYHNAMSLYLSWQATEKLKLNARGEYANGTNPVTFTDPNIVPSNLKVGAATFTADYSLWANVLSRLELRWDHDLSQRSDGALFDGSGTTFGETAPLNDRKNLFTIALNIVYKF
jgi:Putative beta-barrel porin-2, OmpL-like. bbp2